MMGGNGIFSQALDQVVGHALGQPPRVDEDERRTVCAYQFGDAVINFVPHLVGGNGAKGNSWHFNGNVEGALVADVDDSWRGPSIAGKEVRDFFYRLLRGCKSDAHRRLIRNRLQPL